MPKGDLQRRANNPPPIPSASVIAGGSVMAQIGDTDTVDNVHASRMPAAGQLLALDGNLQFPASTIQLADSSGLEVLASGLTIQLAGTTGLQLSASGLALLLADNSGLRATTSGLTVDGTVVRTSRQITTSAPLLGGGALSADINIRLDTSANLTWTGVHAFQATMTAQNIQPQLPDTYDLGGPTQRWRKGYISELDAVVFAKETMTLLGGWFVVSKGTGTLPADVHAADAQVDFGRAMTAGDWVLFRAAELEEYMQVGALASGTTYAVTRDMNATGAKDWPTGTPFAILGQAGSGRIELNAYTTPRLSVITQGAAYNDQKEVVRIGDLNGAFGTGAEEYGFGVGDYTSRNYMTYNPTDGFLISAGNGQVQIGANGIFIPGYGGGNPTSMAAFGMGDNVLGGRRGEMYFAADYTGDRYLRFRSYKLDIDGMPINGTYMDLVCEPVDGGALAVLKHSRGNILYDDARFTAGGSLRLNEGLVVGTLTPASPPGTGQVQVCGTPPEIQFIQGSNAAKAHIYQASSGFQLSYNAWYDGSSWHRDDEARAAALIAPNETAAFIVRWTGAGTGAITWGEFMRITTTGQMLLTTGVPEIQLIQPGVIAKGRVCQASTGVQLSYNASYDGTNWSRDDTSAPVAYLAINNRYPLTLNYAAEGANPISFTTFLRVDYTGKLGVGTNAPTALLDVNSDTMRLRSSRTPASATASGDAGTICWDSGYIYICVAANQWKRAPIYPW